LIKSSVPSSPAHRDLLRAPPATGRAPRGRSASADAPTRADDACARLRAAIVDGSLASGERLKIDALASRLGLSHMPVREALRRLEGEGLVLVEANRGARVRPLDARFVDNLFDLRTALEAMLTRRAAERADAAALDELERIEAKLEAAATRGDPKAVLAANHAFHRCIYAASGNDEARDVVDRHWDLIAALWARHGYGRERYAGVVADHRAILEALRARDGDTAAALAIAHSARAKQALLAKMGAGRPR
jgi:DNA-binding GntR family transcriptional regulator